MIFSSMTYDPNPVPVTYTDDELRKIIQEYVTSNPEFSFRSICNHIVYKAKAEQKCKDAETTQYSSSEISPAVGTEISKILWNLIWERKIIIDFMYNQYASNYSNDTRFLVIT